MRRKTIIAALLGGLLSSASQGALPKLNLDMGSITVSGISSGGYMANQLHIAHSDWVKGAGIIAAGAYYCGQNDIKVALSQCVNKVSDNFSLEPLHKQLINWAQENKIAPLEHLKQSKVWLLHGTKDEKVIAPVTQALHQQYQQLLSDDALKFVNDKPFAHHFPTLEKGSECSASESPFIGNCDYDAAGEMLTFLIGDLSERSPEPKGKVLAFAQQELGGEQAKSLADTGYLYVPQSCQLGESCQLHIAFHGCNQNAEAIGTKFIEQNGLNNWADNNHMVVLYPQAKSSLFMPLNPQGCWDWWGYTDEHYATRDGQQIQAVSNMAKQLANQ